MSQWCNVTMDYSALFLFVLWISVMPYPALAEGTPNIIDARGQSISRGVYDGVAFANFVAQKFSYLNITSLGNVYVLNGRECGFACADIPSCFSYNLAVSYGINGRMLCELLPSDKYNNSDKFIASQFFHHFSIVSSCMSGACQNGESCVSIYEKNSYLCICAKGYTGRHCQTDIDDCASYPCKNNGTCTDRVSGFNCSCAPGFNGTRCETNIDDCASHPCKNNGNCTDRVNGFNCTCTLGFNGTQCERGLLSHSTIIGGNASYQSRLYQFLTPAVGLNYQWVLCYRTSTHGWATSDFHSRCNGKRDTVTIIKKGQYVFGGYTDVPWESSSYGSTSNAFIFSLRNKEGLRPFKSIVDKSTYAVYRYPSHGPTFGGGFGGFHDIYIADNANSNSNSFSSFGSAYSVPSEVNDSSTILAGSHYFSPDEMEVFYLV